MAEQTMRDELNEAKQQMKEAARASLMAVRTMVDFALSKLDDEAPPKHDDARPNGEPPPSPPHDA